MRGHKVLRSWSLVFLRGGGVLCTLRHMDPHMVRLRMLMLRRWCCLPASPPTLRSSTHSCQRESLDQLVQGPDHLDQDPQGLNQGYEQKLFVFFVYLVFFFTETWWGGRHTHTRSISAPDGLVKPAGCTAWPQRRIFSLTGRQPDAIQPIIWKQH